MGRKLITKKHFPNNTNIYNHFLINLLINRILKNGKKLCAQYLIFKSFQLIKSQTQNNPILIFEKAIRNISPKLQLVPKYLGETTYYIPKLATSLYSVKLAITWLILVINKKKSSQKFISKLAYELIDASKGIGLAIKKKEELYKKIESNKKILQSLI